MSISRLVCNVGAYDSASCVWFSEWRGLCRRRHLVGCDGNVVKISKTINSMSRFNYKASRFYYNGR